MMRDLRRFLGGISGLFNLGISGLHKVYIRYK